IRYLGIRYHDLVWHACHQIAALYGKICRWICQFWQCSANFYFDLFGSTVADHDIVLAANVLNDIRVEVIPRNTDRLIAHYTRQCDNSDLGSTTANIDDHVAHWFFHINTDTYGSSHWLVDEVNFFGACNFGAVAYGAFFHLGNTRGNTD